MFRVRLTRTSTSRTTGAQKELFRQGINFQKCRAKKLNSMWGKWTQNQNKTQTTLVTSVKKLYELQTSPGTDVTNLIVQNDDVVWVSWKHSEDNIAEGKNVNVAVAA